MLVIGTLLLWLAIAPTPASAAAFGSLSALAPAVGCIGDPSWDDPDGCTIGRALRYVHHVALSPDGRHLYSAAGGVPLYPRDHGSVGVFSRNAQTGAVRQLDGARGCFKRRGTEEGDEGCGAARNLGASRFVTVSSDGRFVYTGGWEGVSIFRRNAGTGELTQLPGVRGCLNPVAAHGCRLARGTLATEDLAISPDGRFAYVSSSRSSAVAVLRRDRRSGTLVPLAGKAGCVTERRVRSRGVRGCARGRGLEFARSATFSPDARFLYVSALDDSLAIFRRNRSTGTLRQLPARRGCLDVVGQDGCERVRGLFGPHRISFAPSGRFAYMASKRGSDKASSVTVFRWDRATGRLRQLPGGQGCIATDERDGCLPGRRLSGSHAVEFDSEGRTAYLSADGNNGGVNVFRVNRSTGILTQLPGRLGCLDDPEHSDLGCGDVTRLGGIHYTVLSPDERFVYGAGEDSRAVVVLTRNTR